MLGLLIGVAPLLVVTIPDPDCIFQPAGIAGAVTPSQFS
jgi:hypothetical protein